jgi:hypothetical protein
MVDGSRRSGRFAMSRISRGMHRLGVVIAAPIAVAGLVMAGDALLDRRADIASDEIRAALAVDARAKALPPLPQGFVLDKEPWKKDPIAAPSPGPSLKYRPVDYDPFAPELMTKNPIQYFAMSLLVLALSVVSYLAFRSIGWVADGFSRDPDLKK